MPKQSNDSSRQTRQKEGKSASTQAGEFVRQEIDTIREGKHGARNTKQAIAIGLSEARRAGVGLKQPKKGSVSEQTVKMPNGIRRKVKNIHLSINHAARQG